MLLQGSGADALPIGGSQTRDDEREQDRTYEPRNIERPGRPWGTTVRMIRESSPFHKIQLSGEGLSSSWHGFQWLWITVFSDDETEDRSSRMNSEEYGDILSKKAD